VISEYAASCARRRSCSRENATASSSVGSSATAAVGFEGKPSHSTLVRADTRVEPNWGRKPVSSGCGSDTGMPPASRVPDS
jgi:hypothetical protein